MPSQALSLVVFAGVLGLDLASKAWAAALVEPVRIADWLYLVLRHNSGMFFGTVPVSAGYWVGVCAALGWFGWRALRAKRAPVALCLAVVLAGLVGNAIGQARGVVVDFIGVGPVTGDVWLVANVADIALAGGVLVLGIYLLRERVRRAHQPRQGRPGDLHARHLRAEVNRHDQEDAMPSITTYANGDPHHVRAQQVWMILVAHIMRDYQRRGDSAAPCRIEGALMTYEELAGRMGWKVPVALAGPLGIVGNYCCENGLPSLSSMVVRKYTREPGEGVVLREGKTCADEQHDVMKTDWFMYQVPTIEAFRRVRMASGWR